MAGTKNIGIGRHAKSTPRRPRAMQPKAGRGVLRGAHRASGSDLSVSPLARFLRGIVQVRAPQDTREGRSGPGLPDHIRTSFPDQHSLMNIL
jgi:hypothetical protein